MVEEIDWLLVMAVPGITQATECALSQVLALLRPDRLLGVSIVDTRGDTRLKKLCADSGAAYNKCITEPFSWGYAANIGAFALPCRKLCFLHSDISIQPGMIWLDALAQAVDLTHGLAAPVIDGASPNPLQHYRGPVDIPYYHTTSYLSNACFALERSRFLEIGGFHSILRGIDWWANYLQEKMAQCGLPTVVVPASQIQHTGSGVSSGNAVQRLQNMNDFCTVTEIYPEYRVRPSRVRSRIPCDYSQAILVDGFHITTQSIETDGYNEIVIVDSKPSRESFEKCRSFKRWSYSPVLDEHPERLAVELSGGNSVTVLDRRISPLVSGATGRPWRCGHGYALPQHLTEMHITNVLTSAIGDTLMMTPALSALKRQYPWIRIHVHTSTYSLPLLQGHPAIHELHALDKCISVNQQPFYEMNPEAVSIGLGVGYEGTAACYYTELGMDVPDKLDPIILILEDDEKLAARQWIIDAGIDLDKPVIGLVLHGGWRAKYWRRSNAACKIFTRKGYQVLTFGTDDNRSDRINLNDVFHVCGLSIRTVAAIISQLDGMIGYDSGLSYVSVAVETPVVALFGPHDPYGLIGQAGGGKMVAIRKRTPAMCKSEFGKSCRQGSNIGEVCVLRTDPGGKCIDDISVHDVITELESIVKRKPC